MTDHRKRRKKKPKPGEKVILKALPPGFIDDLPEEDQRAISAVVGKPIILNKYENDGRAGGRPITTTSATTGPQRNLGWPILAGFARVGLPFARLFSLTNLLTFDLQTSQRILPPLSRSKPRIRGEYES